MSDDEFRERNPARVLRKYFEDSGIELSDEGIARLAELEAYCDEEIEVGD